MENQSLIPQPPAAGLSGASVVPREEKAEREEQRRLGGEGGRLGSPEGTQRLDSVDMRTCHLALCSSVQTPSP